MSEVLQANVFFFITAGAVVVFTIFLCIATYHVIKILSSIRKIAKRIEEGSEILAEDISSIRNYVTEGSIISRILGFIAAQRHAHEEKSGSKRKKPAHTTSISEE